MAEFARAESLFRLRERIDSAKRPMEVERFQVGGGCLVSLLMQDNRAASMQVFHADAADRNGERIGRQFDFDPAGFPKGSVAHVVFPDVECGEMMLRGWGAGVVWRPHAGMNVR